MLQVFDFMEYKRKQYFEVLSRLDEPRDKMQVIVGPRQVGKSTLIGQVLEACRLPYDAYSADDVIGASAFWLSQVWETARMRMGMDAGAKRLLVIDEIQKIVNWSEVVKAEWDKDTREKRNLVVVLLGSSRMLIEKGLTESLAGRYELIRLTHWSFAEMKECFGWNVDQYVYYGGYPGAATYISDERRWRNYVKDALIEPSISKDVLMNTRIIKPQLLRQLFEVGCGYSGELLSLTKVAAQLQDVGNITTLAGYLSLLNECELLCGLQRFAMDNARKYNSIPKFQVYNNALRNVYVDNDFADVLTNAKAWGRYVESAVGAYIVSQAHICDYKAYYWRYNSEEVDFVLFRRGKTIAIEVKSGRRTTNSGLPKFAKAFNPYKAIVVGSGGLSFEEFLSVDLEMLFR